LDKDSYDALRCKTIEKLQLKYGHILAPDEDSGILQNRVLRYGEWVNAAKTLK